MKYQYHRDDDFGKAWGEVKSDCQKGRHDGQYLGFCRPGHGPGGHKILQVFFVNARGHEPAVKALGAFSEKKQRQQKERGSGKNWKGDPHTADSKAGKRQNHTDSISYFLQF